MLDRFKPDIRPYVVATLLHVRQTSPHTPKKNDAYFALGIEIYGPRVLWQLTSLTLFRPRKGGEGGGGDPFRAP